MAAQAVLRLQGQAGNAAVSALLARRVLARGEPADAKPAPPRPLPDGFEWVGSAQAPKLIVSRAWLESMVPRGATDVTGAKYPEVLRPIVVKLLTFYPWAQPRQAEILGRIDDVRLQLTKESWEDEQFEVPMDRTVFRTIGQLPPDAPIQVYRVGSGLEVYADTRGLGATGDVEAEDLKGAAARVVGQVEETVKLAMVANLRTVVEGWVASKLAGPPRLEVLKMDEASLRSIFGEKEWGDYLTQSESEGPEQGAVLTLAGGAFRLAPNLTEEDRKFVEETLKQLLGESKAGGAAGQQPLTIYPSDVAKLRELTNDPKRVKQLKAMLKRAGKSGGGKEGYFSFADMVETLGEAAEIEEAAEQLKIKLGSGERDEEPIDRRPVRGEIINKTGALVPEQEGRFEFMTHDNVDAFRVPMVKIKWYAVDGDGKTVDDEPTRYIEVRPDGYLNDRVFEVTFKKTGLYKVHAFVDHNFFLPAHFTLPVEVRTERERLSDLDRRAGFGTAKGGWKPHRFKDVDEEDRATTVIDILGPAPIPQPKGKDYAAGRRSTGTIDPELLAVEGGSVEMGIRIVAGEIEELEKLRKDVEVRGGSDKAEMLKWIDERLGRLKETREKFTGARKDKDAYPIHCQGSYVARTNRAPGGPLTLVSWFTFNERTRKYEGHLMDHSELLKSETYHFKAEDENYERMMERLFFELTRTYPDGSMTFAFQVYKGLEPTGDYVRFERVTDTAVNDARDFWYSDEASLAINILSALLSVFPPTMAIGITIGLVYNTAQALDTYAEAERTGTLRAEHKVGLALAALDIVPAVGKGGKLIRLGARTYRIIDAAQYAGQAYMMATSATGEIENLRDQKLSRLAKLGEEIKRLKRTNASDPQLRAIEDEAERLRHEIRNASNDVLTTMGGNFLLQMGPIAAINAFAARGGGGGGVDTPDRPGADVPPSKPETSPKTPDTPPKTPDTATPAKPRPTVAKDAILAEGLPDHVRGDVPVLRDESIHDNTVRVEYKMEDGLVTEVSIRAGRAATKADIQLHAQTASLMLGYRGVSGRIRVLLERYKAFIVGGGTPPPVGSRAWEAKLEIDKLPRIIRDRMQKLEAGVDAATAARLQAEIEYLTGQLERHAQTFERMDLEAGSGRVAAEGEHHQRAIKDGYPSLDDAPGHYYEPTPGGGYELRQRADSTDPPFKLATENGRRVLQKGEHKPLPGLALPPPTLRRVLDVMTGEQAQALAQWVGPQAFAELAGAKTTDGLRRALRAHERVVPLLSDPDVVKGLDRLIGGRGAKTTPMGMDSRLDALEGVPDGNLRDFLIWVGREEWQHPHGMGPGRLTKVGAATDELRFMVRYGREVYNELKAPRDVFEKLTAHLRTLDDAAADAFVKEMVAAGSPVPRERLLKMPKRPPARRSTRHGRADPKDERWPDYMREARDFLGASNDKGPRKDLLKPDADGNVDFEAAVEAYATVLQVSARVTARWEAQQKLPHAQKLRILQDLDDIGRHGGLPDTWINNARGDVAEALFAPGGGRKQISIPNPEHPAPGGGPGRTQLDGVYEPGKRPKSDSPVREWVEVKSDIVDLPGKQGRASAEAVRLAREYAKEGLEDWDALRANPGTKDDRIVIHFARTPDAVTQKAMLDVLLGPDSPFAAVGFGKDWHNRPSMDNMPKGFQERQAAAIPVPVGTPTPLPVGSGG